MKTTIIGAGICGLYLAWKLAEKGHYVTVLEKKAEIGNDVCSGLFSERILDFIPQSRKLIQNRINSVFLNFPGKKIKVVFSKQFLVMSHFKLDRLVAALAREAGAKIVLNYNVSSMPEGYDRLIGCDGVDSFVRKNLGLPEPNCRLGILGFTETRVSDISSVETWPCRNGFIWKIPRGAGTEYGIIADLIEARQIFSQFLEKNKIVLEGVKAKKVPQGFIMPKNYSIALCGDALGLTKPWSGGGVVWGLTAAQILLKTFPDFIKYRKAMKRFFLPKIIFSRAAVKLVYFLGFRTPLLLPKETKMESDFLL